MKEVFLQAPRPGSGFGSGSGEWLIILIFIAVIVAIFWRKKVNVSANEVRAFVDYQIPIQEFYKSLEDLVNQYQMPNVSISRINYPTDNILSDRREYLRIARKDSIFDICVSPFGRGSFVSYWYGEPKKTLKELTRRVATTYIKNPDVHQILDNFDQKTRYQYDTDGIFQLWVKDCIKEAIEEFKTSKGIRTPIGNL